MRYQENGLFVSCCLELQLEKPKGWSDSMSGGWNSRNIHLSWYDMKIRLLAGMTKAPAHSLSMELGFLAQCYRLGDDCISPPTSQTECGWPFITQPLKSYSIIFSVLYSLKQSKAAQNQGMGNLIPPPDGGGAQSHDGRAHKIGDMYVASFRKYNLLSASHHTWNKIHSTKEVTKEDIIL